MQPSERLRTPNPLIVKATIPAVFVRSMGCSWTISRSSKPRRHAMRAAYPRPTARNFGPCQRISIRTPRRSEAIFDFIYARGVWGGGSGAGSDFSRTVLYVAYVQALMDRHDVRSVLDLGCGDWRFSRYLDFSGRDYTGFDVVPSVVAANRAAFGTPNIRFEQADLSTHPEFAPCDLILCKDVLQHLSNARVSAILSKCGVARLALITNDYHPENSDCRDGETRPLDVTAPPFGFSARPVLRFGRKVSFLSERAGSMSRRRPKESLIIVCHTI